MQNYDDSRKSHRIYDKYTCQWFKVTPKQYAEFDRWRTNLRKHKQHYGHCTYTRKKWWLCDGICDGCEFHAPNDTLSLNQLVSNDEGEEVTLLDTLMDSAPPIESVICDKAEMDQLFERLNDLVPEAMKIGKLRQAGLTDETIAKIIGINRTTFLSRLNKAKAQLSTEYPDLF